MTIATLSAASCGIALEQQRVVELLCKRCFLMSAELQTMVSRIVSRSSNFVEQIKPDPTYIETDTRKRQPNT
jgi:hypothetical protein